MQPALHARHAPWNRWSWARRPPKGTAASAWNAETSQLIHLDMAWHEFGRICMLAKGTLSSQAF